ncbi:30S ribosomal protein S8 [uncultured archaeon]|nr:30S ribosomal protein S8 [uncultured archaeon]
MKSDVVADAFNMIMNAKKVEKTEVRINRISKFLVQILQMMKDQNYIDFEVKEDEAEKPYLIVKMLKLNECKAIKPRYSVSVERIDKYLRRYLPSRNFGTMIVSTNKGLMTHEEAYKNNLGGSLVAYFY